MEYTYLKPKTTSILKDSWILVSKDWIFWVPIIFTVIFRLPIFMVSVVYFIIMFNKARTLFWKEFAELNGWTYKDKDEKGFFESILTFNDSRSETGLMFREGQKRAITNEIEGKINERPFRIFCYQFTIGQGKNSTTYSYTVFGFKFNGLFPHIYLNNRHNLWNINSNGEKISLPREFEKEFTLFVPRKYETEALEIFTPDILSKLLDSKFSYDVEFVNQEILIFVDGVIDNAKELELGFDKSLELQDLFSKKLDKFKFELIGDMTSRLS